MAQAIALNAEIRTGTGKGAARQLRQAGRIPAVIYGHGRESQSLSVSAQDIERVLAGVTTGTAMFELAIDGTPVRALIREIQRHPLRSVILHIDFLEIRAGEKLTLEVPIRLVGSPDGVRNAGGVLDQTLREVEIEVLPRHIPEYIELDVTDLAVGSSLNVSDLVVPDANVLADPETTVCSVVPPRVEEEPEAAEVEIEEELAEPELIRKSKEEEGEEAEGSEE